MSNNRIISRSELDLDKGPYHGHEPCIDPDLSTPINQIRIHILNLNPVLDLELNKDQDHSKTKSHNWIFEYKKPDQYPKKIIGVPTVIV